MTNQILPMLVTVTCINMEHDFYVRNYAETRLQQRAMILTTPPTQADVIIRLSGGVKYVSCELSSFNNCRVYVEHSGHDLYKLINDVSQRVITQLSLNEMRHKALLNQPGSNVIDFCAKSRLLKGSRPMAHDFQR